MWGNKVCFSTWRTFCADDFSFKMHLWSGYWWWFLYSLGVAGTTLHFLFEQMLFWCRILLIKGCRIQKHAFKNLINRIYLRSIKSCIFYLKLAFCFQVLFLRITCLRRLMRNLYCELGAGCKTIARNCDAVMLKVCKVKFSEATTDQRYLNIYMLMVVFFVCVVFF